MTHYDHQYELGLADIMKRGAKKSDRTGTGTTSLFGLQMRWDLAKGFPLITTKKVHIKSVVTELLWMLSGSTNVQDLQAMGCTIWDEWAREDGSLGPVYGQQWRSWPNHHWCQYQSSDEPAETIDQLSEVVANLKANPDGRRHVVSAWNVADLPEMALAPCHCLFQFYVADGRVSCQLYQRSADMFLGVPFNIASYALLTHMVAQQCGLQVGEFIWIGGDCHVYDNHRAQVSEQLGRAGLDYPTLQLTKAASLFDYTLADVQFPDYVHHPAIRAPVAV